MLSNCTPRPPNPHSSNPSLPPPHQSPAQSSSSPPHQSPAQPSPPPHQPSPPPFQPSPSTKDHSKNRNVPPLIVAAERDSDHRNVRCRPSQKYLIRIWRRDLGTILERIILRGKMPNINSGRLRRLSRRSQKRKSSRSPQKITPRA